MYGYVKDDKIVETFANAKAITIDNITHPAQIFTAWSEAELNAIGIYKVNAGVMGDDRFETTSSPSYTWDSTNKEINTSYTITDKTLADLKTQAITDTNNTAYKLIKRVSWLVERNIFDSSKAIPDSVKNYVIAIQKDADDISTEITNASNMSTYKAIFTDELNTDGSVKTVNRFNRWTSENTVTSYLRET
tara:strand:+ start:2191 stop:2763 length:573 start_codon:yes stop_codon:yes gene_type:complete